MRRFVLGTAGHIDHGKTSLVHALTGVDTDRLAEEKRRGITIDLGFAALRLDNGVELGVVDVPGHEGFIRNMLAGATGIDLVLLVVAADEGVMPQTREHLAIVELLGVRGGVVAVTKTDLVDDDWLELVLDELRDGLAHTPFAGAPLVPVSVQSGQGLDALRAALGDAAATLAARDTDDLFRLPVDRVFTVRGTGTVATGTVWTGTARRDETLRLLPAGLRARARRLQAHGQDREAVHAGQRAAIAIAGVDRDAVRRGDVLVNSAAWDATQMLTARIRLIAGTDWTLRQRQRVRFHLGTAEVMARIALLGDDGLGPGEAGWAQLRLETPVVARAGDRFVIRSYSPVTTIGGGVIAEPAPDRRRRLSERDSKALGTILDGSVDEGLTARARLAGWEGASASRLPIELPHTAGAVDDAIGRLDGHTILRVGDRVFDAAIADQAAQVVRDAADAFHQTNPIRTGMGREELRRALPVRTHPVLAEATIDRLIDNGELRAAGSLIHRAGFVPTLAPEQEQLRERILDRIQQADLTPPTITELQATAGEHPDLWPILRLLEHEDRIVPLTAELFAARDAVDRAAAAVRRALADRHALAPADFKTLFPISRKYLIPLLEYLDRAGITVRRGDERILSNP